MRLPNFLMLILAVALSLLSMVVSVLAVAIMLRVLALRDDALVRPIAGASSPAIESIPSRPLQGVRVGISISQDHPHAPFLTILREHLFAEDVADVQTILGDQASKMRGGWNRSEGPDFLIVGNVTCNGYSDVYYEAELMCYEPDRALCTLIEKPPHGDRPSNLALEMVARMKKELEKQTGRNERRQAIQELNG